LRWWQLRASRGCVEAVTGTGKTLVGLACIALAHDAGHRVLVLVPTVVLQDQWIERVRSQLPRLRISRLGGSDRSTADSSAEHDVLIAVINSASTAAETLQGRYGCLVADECHRYGARAYQKALIDAPWRLGLTGTLERLDDGIDSVIRPYFGETYTYSYDRATADRVLASFVIAMVGMRLSDNERADYLAADEAFKKAYGTLVNKHGYPGSDFGELFRRASGASGGIASRFTSEGRAARTLVKSFADRRAILAESPGRLETLRALAPCVTSAGKALVFTETVDAANAACRALRELAIEAAPYHSDIAPADRADTLQRFKQGQVRALIAVKALDEGVDVPDVDLGIVLTASQQRRQMVQRLGRVIRKKPDGRYACFVHVFAEGTGEDPDQGAQESFVDQIQSSADEFERFGATRIDAALRFINDFAGKRPDVSASGPKPVDELPTDVAKVEIAMPKVIVGATEAMPIASARDDATAPQAGSTIDRSVRIGSRVFDVDQEIERQDLGSETALSYRGQRIGRISRTESGLIELEILVAAHQSIRLVNPTVDMKRAAMTLGMLAAERRRRAD
jgi:superfamily II DNA or RNA helicase